MDLDCTGTQNDEYEVFGDYGGAMKEEYIEGEVSEFDENIEKIEDKVEQEFYRCTSCEESFTDVMDHIRKFHKNQSVVIDTGNGAVPKQSHNVEEESVFDLDSFPSFNDEKFNYKNINDSDSDEINNYNSCEDIDEDDKEGFNEYQTFEAEINESEIIEQDDVIEAKNSEEITNSLSTISTSKIDKDEKSSKICSICKTTFASIKNLKLHMRMHNPVKPKSIVDALGYSNKLGKSKLFFCKLCDKSFDLNLKVQHSKFHQKETPNSICNVCNKEFKNESTFQLHMTLHESNGQPAITPILKKPTKSEKAGIIHPFACQYCGRSFKRPHEKVKHERIHTGEKPYKCEVCGKSFRVSYSLTLHLRTHTGHRPYVCSTCNKRFKGYSTYAHHLLIHSDERNFKCSECPKSFKTAVQLHGHRNTHKKPFFCSKCNRPFATMYAVETHMETHKYVISKKNLRYFCEICGASYGRSFALEEHKQEAHGPDFNESHLAYLCDEEIIETNDNIFVEGEYFKEEC